MPDTIINIQLGIRDISKDGALVGAQKILNLIEGTGITITAVNDPSDETVDITFASTGDASIPLIDASVTPIVVGTPIAIPTTFPINSTVYELIVKGTGLNGDILQIGIDVDHEDYFSETTADINQTSTRYSASNRTTSVNRDILIQAIDADITTGTIEILIKYK